MLKKTRRTQFFEDFEKFCKLLILNILHPNPAFSSPNHIRNPPTFQFLFRHTFKTINYTLLNILPEDHRFLPRKQDFFKFQRAVLKFPAH